MGWWWSRGRGGRVKGWGGGDQGGRGGRNQG